MRVSCTHSTRYSLAYMLVLVSTTLVVAASSTKKSTVVFSRFDCWFGRWVFSCCRLVVCPLAHLVDFPVSPFPTGDTTD